MAIAGGATVAYKCRLVSFKLDCQQTTAQNCIQPLPAVAAILRGEVVTVAGSDVVVVARLIELELKVKQMEGEIAGLMYQVSVRY